MGVMLRERAHESALMEQRRLGDICAELQPEPQLPSGWEKCLDLKSGLIYFKDWNSGTLTYRDPRQTVAVPTQRIGLLSISLSTENMGAGAVKASSNAGEGTSKRTKRRGGRVGDPVRVPCGGLSMGQITATTVGDSSDRENSLSMDEVNDQSLELSLTLPGSTSRPAPTTSNQGDSVCTMEKVRTALERSQWLTRRPRPIAPLRTSACTTSSGKLPSDSLSTALSLLSSRPSSSRESNSPGLHSESCSKSESPSTSQCSSVCFTSPSVMSYQGDDEEVQQPRACRESGAKSQVWFGKQDPVDGEVMVTVGCKSCLMYVMLSKSHPSCPKCGNTDVLLELPAPLPKKQRMSLVQGSPTWSWCTA